MKTLLGCILALCGAWFLFSVYRSEPEWDEIESPAGPRVFTSSRECQECHAEVYAEWEGSQHAMSWNNPAVRERSNDFSNQDCIDCHAPRPIFVTGVGERVLPRATRRSEGVDCLSCHLLPDGRMAGTITNDRAPCRPVERLDLTRPEFCAGCHNQHKTVDQWRESEWPDRSQDCLDCHMPYPGGDSNLPRTHAFPGGNVLAMVKEAVALRGLQEDGKWFVEIENVGAGHSFPTDERSRASDLFWRPLGSTEAADWRHLHRMRSPYRTETDIPETLLFAHEIRRFPIEGEGAEGPIEVALFYMRKPYWQDPETPDPEREAQLVHRIELEP